jgi:hypothetical protein
LMLQFRPHFALTSAVRGRKSYLLIVSPRGVESSTNTGPLLRPYRRSIAANDRQPCCALHQRPIAIGWEIPR